MWQPISSLPAWRVIAGLWNYKCNDYFGVGIEKKLRPNLISNANLQAMLIWGWRTMQKHFLASLWAARLELSCYISNWEPDAPAFFISMDPNPKTMHLLASMQARVPWKGLSVFMLFVSCNFSYQSASGKLVHHWLHVFCCISRRVLEED